MEPPFRIIKAKSRQPQQNKKDIAISPEPSPMRKHPALLLPLILTLFFIAPARAGDVQMPNLPAAPFGDFAGNDAIFSAFGAAEPKLLTVSLAPESATIAPGTPFRLILTLAHANGGYTYFPNPGGPGAGTRVHWTLPEGFTAEGPAWPAPERYEHGGMTFYVYKGITRLVYTVTPPDTLAPGARITLRGDVDTQACTPRSCTPMRLPVEAAVTAAAAPGAPDTTAEEAVAALPALPIGWRVDAEPAGAEIRLALRPPEGVALESAYFFDARETPLIDSQQPQILENRGETPDARILRLPRLSGPAGSSDATLAGILRTDGGAFLLNLPLTAPGIGAAGAFAENVWILAFAFLGGLLLNVMPCVFPVISLKVLSFAKQAHAERRLLFLHGLAYAAGVLICFWTLALFVITMGRGWGAQLQADWFLFLLCHVFLIMSLNMAGVFEVGAVPGMGLQVFRAKEGLKRSFCTGLLATLTSTPCSAPFLGSVLAYALALPPLLSLGVFTLMALGFAFPYLALSLFPGWLKRLPKPGEWMETLRQAMSFPLFGTTAYLFWTMEAMVEEWRFLLLLFGLVLTGMACWLYGKAQKSGLLSGESHRRRARWLGGLCVLSLAAGLWLGFPRGGSELEWRDWSPETVADLRRRGVPVYVDFTARWCATCQLNKRVYTDDSLGELVRGKNVVLLKADWTLHDERITRALRDEFAKAAIPVTVLYPPGAASATVLPDILTVDAVSEALRGLP